MSLHQILGLANVRFLINQQLSAAGARMVASAVAVLLLMGGDATCQSATFSENGWRITPRDTLRVLVVYAEIDFDTEPELNPFKEAGKWWPAGELPTYKDSLLDPFSAIETKAPLTDYFYQMSLGNLIVLGDYLDHLITIPYSQLGTLSESKFKRAVCDSLNALVNLKTASNLSLKDFDLWLDEKGSGQPKEKNTGNLFEGVDHLMLIVRNLPDLRTSNGRASAGSIGNVFGKPTDSHSMMGGYAYPFFILKHEFSHLLVGGNNFHAGGGNEAHFLSYFLPVQSGWSLMGGYEQSLMTCNGWDRYWLGWKAPDKQFLISALTEEGREVATDIDAEDTTAAGVYVLRDFVSTGDVMRIKLPFIPDSSFQQYLWVENHTTSNLNGGRFDNFIYSDFDCMEGATPGLYLQMQVEKNEKTGNGIYGGEADFLRPIPANGLYDVSWKSKRIDNGWCVGRVNSVPIYKQSKLENPLSGNQDQERIYRAQPDAKHLDKNDMHLPVIWQTADSAFKYYISLGLGSHGFSQQGNAKISIGSNPSTASMLTLVNRRSQSTPKRTANNRAVYLNGISIEILETFGDGAIKLQLRLDETRVDENRRWCAPLIILPDIPGADQDLVVNANLTLDFGLTATRLDEPEIINGKPVFNSPTTLKVSKNANVSLSGSGILELQNKSEVIFGKGSKLKMEAGSKLILRNNSRIEFHDSTQIVLDKKSRIRVKSGSKIYCTDLHVYKLLRKKVKPASKIILVNR